MPAGPYDGLTTAFTDGIADATPVIIAVVGAVIGLVFLLAIARFIVKRVRGSVN